MITLDSTRVFDRSLRGAHDTIVLLASLVGTVSHEASRTAPSTDRAAEAAHVAGLLRSLTTSLDLVAGTVNPVAETKEAA